MKKINLLVTGLALGTFGHEDVCDACNYNFEWLLDKPASLIYADKIIIPKHIYETIQAERIGGPNLSKSIKKVFEIAENFNLLDIKSPDHVITKKLSNDIEREIEFDAELLTKLFPNSISMGNAAEVPGQIFVEGVEFCQPHIRSIYTGLLLAQKWKAESLFSDDVYTYCKYKFGLSIFKNQKSSIKAFDNIFTTLMPEQSIFPHYTFIESGIQGKLQCSNCAKLERCEKNYLSDIEGRVHTYLELRDRDEIAQIKSTLNTIIAELEKTKPVYSNEDLIAQFHSEEIKIKRDLKKTFPKIQRLTNISIIASTPAILLGLATGLPSISYASASIAGISSGVKEMLAYSKNKYKWVSFLNKRKKVK